MKRQRVLEHRFEEVLETLQLIGRLATEVVSPQRRRSWVLEYCRRCAVKERSVWDSLALYRLAGPQAILSDHGRQGIFSLQHAHVGEAIISTLPGASQEVLEEFRCLLRFGEQFLERIGFLCDWMLELFLTEKPWIEPYEGHLRIEVLLSKFSEELELLHQHRLPPPILQVFLRFSVAHQPTENDQTRVSAAVGGVPGPAGGPGLQKV